MLRQSLSAKERTALLAPLAAVDARLAATYPGGVPAQPPHTCYVPADRLRVSEARLWGDAALGLLAQHAPDAGTLGAALGRDICDATHADVTRILTVSPVRDLRVDFEDGYGRRPDGDEDAAVDAAVAALQGDPPPAYGLRVKAFEGPSAQRGARTLDRWLTGLAAAGLPSGTLTLPKVQAPEQVTVALDVLEALESVLGIDPVRVELQIETAAGVLDRSGRVTVASLLDAGRGRVAGLHFGTYDYTAALGLSPREQALDAPPADAAKDLLQLAAAARGVSVCDGSSNRLPVGDRAAVHVVWREHSRLVFRALSRGLWQGWDMHPGQLVSRWATHVQFLRDRVPEARERLAGARPEVLDEPATAVMLQALLVRAAALGLSVD